MDLGASGYSQSINISKVLTSDLLFSVRCPSCMENWPSLSSVQLITLVLLDGWGLQLKLHEIPVRGLSEFLSPLVPIFSVVRMHPHPDLHSASSWPLAGLLVMLFHPPTDGTDWDCESMWDGGGNEESSCDGSDAGSRCYVTVSL